MADTTTVLVGFGLLAAQCYAATKLETTELAFVILGCGALGGWAGVPYGAMTDSAVLALITRYLCYLKTNP